MFDLSIYFPDLFIYIQNNFVKLREIEGQRVDSGSRLLIVNC